MKELLNSATWLNLRNIALSGKIHIQKSTYWIDRSIDREIYVHRLISKPCKNLSMMLKVRREVILGYTHELTFCLCIPVYLCLPLSLYTY